jgi:hypothetical protein
MNSTQDKAEKKEETVDVLRIGKDALGIAETLVKAGAAVLSFSDNRRTAYSQLIDRAFASLIDQVEAVRRALREIVDECDAGDRVQVALHLRRLGNSSAWEKMERDMRMCAQLRRLHSQMHSFFGKRTDKIADVDRKKLLDLVDYMINAGEERMADYITQNLRSLADQAPLVKNGRLALKNMREQLVGRIQALTEVRTVLMNLELEARNNILAHSRGQASRRDSNE